MANDRDVLRARLQMPWTIGDPVNPALRGPTDKPTATGRVFPDFNATVVRDLVRLLPQHVGHALTVVSPPLVLRCLTCGVMIVLDDATEGT